MYPKMITDFPLASESYDHIEPKGTMRDNTKNKAYVDELIEMFGTGMRYLDLGCAGGGFVAQFLNQDVFAVGVDGSDYSLIRKRAEWAVWPEYLFTADITKPFTIVEQNTNQLIKFDAISAFDVLEHIHEHDLDIMVENIKKHLSPNGIFIASIAEFEDQGYHVCLHDRQWWKEKFESFGLVEGPNLNNYGRRSSFEVTYRFA